MNISTNDEVKPYKPFLEKFPVGHFLLILFSAILVMACFQRWKEWHHEQFAQEQWQSLKEKSYTHQTMVTAYRDCRDSTSKLVQECLIITSDYAKSVGLQDESVLVIRDIQLTSEIIKESYFLFERKVH